MTKVGEGKEFPKEPSIQKYHNQLDTNAIKFLNALDAYKEGTEDQKAHFRGVMEQSLGLIRSAVEEIKRPGITKQESLVEKDYKSYMKDESSENLSKLEEDLTTLRDYNKL